MTATPSMSVWDPLVGAQHKYVERMAGFLWRCRVFTVTVSLSGIYLVFFTFCSFAKH